MGMMLRLLNSVRAAVVYPFVRFPLLLDNFDRANGNLSSTAPWVHHIITEQYNRVANGKAIGPSTSYSLDYANIRIPNHKGYIKGKLYTPPEVMAAGGQSRLNFRSGKGTDPAPAYSFLSLGIRAESDGRLVYAGAVFRQGWSGYPNWVNNLITLTPQYKVGDEIAVFWDGRNLTLYWNGLTKKIQLTTEQWTAGYFAGIGLDTNHSWDEIEIGYWGDLVWREYGDDFRSANLTPLWLSNVNKMLVVEEGVQSDPVSAVANGTYFSLQTAKQQTHDDDQIVRGIVRRPIGVTHSIVLSAFLIGRAGSVEAEATPRVGFSFSSGAGVNIVTIANGNITNRATTAASSVPTITYPSEFELQCIGNRYFGLIDGQPVVEWNDSTNIVPIGEGRRGWGFGCSVSRSSSTYSYSLGFDSVVANGHSPTPIGPPEILGFSHSAVPMGGLSGFVVLGRNFHPGSRVRLGDTLCADSGRFSTNTIECVLPAKPAGTYDITVTSPNGDTTVIGAVQYVSSVPRGKYDPMVTPLTAGSTYIKVPLNPENPALTSATVNGVIVGLPKGFYRFRAIYTMTSWRSDLRYRPVIPAGALTPFIGPDSSGTVDNAHDFSVGANGTMELQFYRSGYVAQTITEAFDFELILLSSNRLPAWLAKSGTQLLGTVANVYEKITGWTSPLEYSRTTTVVNDEIIVPATGQYSIEWSAPTTTANTANTVRVTNQLGTVIVSKTTPAAVVAQVVTLTQGDSLKLELSITNVSAAGRRTVTTAAVFRITPVV